MRHHFVVEALDRALDRGSSYGVAQSRAEDKNSGDRLAIPPQGVRNAAPRVGEDRSRACAYSSVAEPRHGALSGRTDVFLVDLAGVDAPPALVDRGKMTVLVGVDQSKLRGRNVDGRRMARWRRQTHACSSSKRRLMRSSAPALTNASNHHCPCGSRRSTWS